MDSSKTKNAVTFLPVRDLCLKLALRIKENPSKIWDMIPDQYSRLIKMAAKTGLLPIKVDEIAANLHGLLMQIPDEKWFDIENHIIDLLEGKPGEDEAFLTMLGFGTDDEQ